VVDLPDLNVPLAMSETEWREWAKRLRDLNSLDDIPIASQEYKTWREWAEQVLEVEADD